MTKLCETELTVQRPDMRGRVCQKMLGLLGGNQKI